MSVRDRDSMMAEIRRRRIVELLRAGYSVAKIAKETGWSAKYISMIAAQELQK